MNPAFIGTVPNLSFNSNYKVSGSSSTENYVELWQATISIPFERRRSKEVQVGGIGATAFSERRGFQGIYQAQKFLMTAAYNLKLSRIGSRYLIFGLQAGVTQNRVDGSNLRWGSQYNRYIGFDDSLPDEFVSSDPLYFPSVNFGVIYSAFDNDDYYVRDRSLLLGLSVDNLNEPTITNQGFEDSKKPFLIRSFGTSKWNLNPRLDLHPSFYVLYSQGSIQSNLGLYLSSFLSGVKSRTDFAMQLGSWYRIGDALVVMAGIKIQEFQIGVSMDLNSSDFDTNDALGNQQPALEVSLRYNLKLKQNYFRGVSNPIF